MNDADDQRLNELEARIARIESVLERQGHLKLPPPLPTAMPVAEPPAPIVAREVPEIVQMLDERGAVVWREVFKNENRYGDIVAPPVAEAIPAEPSKAAVFESLHPTAPVAYASPAPSPSTPFEAMPAPLPKSPPALPPQPSAGFEQAIGLKLAGWVGAIVVVIGAAMGVKYAYDQGWLGGFPDSVKLGIYYAVGIGLIGAGEWVYRKVNPVAAVGLYAAGIAGLFVVSYAGNAYYQLYEQPVAFALMAGACAIGAIISLRGGLVSIAVLSLLGANIAPIVMRNRAVGEVPLLVYLLALQLLALGLAHVGKGARWWILRNFALVTLSLWMCGRLVSPTTAFSLPTVCFLCLYAALFQIENTLAARKQGDARFSHSTFSFAVTATFTIAMLRWSMPLSGAQRGGIILLLSFIAFTAGAAVFFTKQLALKALAQSWLVQGGILLFIAAPAALAGPWIFVAWALMALGYVVLGTVLDRSRTAVGGVIVWFAAAALLLIQIVDNPSVSVFHATAFSIAGFEVPKYLPVGVLLTFIGHAIALLLARKFVDARAPIASQSSATPYDPSRAPNELCRTLAIGLAISATLLAAILCIAALPSLPTTAAGIALAWIGFALAFGARSTSNTYHALAMTTITLTLGRWVAMDVVADRFSQEDFLSHKVVLNGTLGLGVLCVASLWAMAKLLGRRITMPAESYSRLVSIAILVGVFAMCVAFSVEIDRAVRQSVNAGAVLAWPQSQLIQFGWTALWAIAAAALPWIARAMSIHPRQRDELKIASTFLVSIIATKFLLHDCLSYASWNRDLTVGVLFNAQTMVGLLLLVLSIFGARTTGHLIAKNVARSIIFLLPLVVGSIEISRIVGPERTLVAFSVYWGLYAIASIAVGFVLRGAVLRFAGLGLLGITLMKIVFVDLANAGTGWRILSFLGLGMILLATSVLYGKLSPLLLGGRDSSSRDGA